MNEQVEVSVTVSDGPWSFSSSLPGSEGQEEVLQDRLDELPFIIRGLMWALWGITNTGGSSEAAEVWDHLFSNYRPRPWRNEEKRKLLNR